MVIQCWGFTVIKIKPYTLEWVSSESKEKFVAPCWTIPYKVVWSSHQKGEKSSQKAAYWMQKAVLWCSFQIPCDRRSRVPMDALRSLPVWSPGPLYTQSHSESSSFGFLHLSPLCLPCVKPDVYLITLTQTCAEALDLNEWLRGVPLAW